MVESTTTIETPTEGGVEGSILRWLEELPGNLRWTVPGLDSDGEGATLLDARYDREKSEVVYWGLLKEKIVDINEDVTPRNVQRLVTSLRRDLTQDALTPGNQAIHRLLCEGKQFEASHNNGTTKRTYVRLIDFVNAENNSFHAVNQMRVTRNHSVRPDVTLLVNGIPLVQMELKSLTQDNDYRDAIDDLHEYERKVPRLFHPNLFNVAADTKRLRYGAIRAPEKFYFPWSKAPEKYRTDNELKQAVRALLNPETLLDILRHFVFYEKAEGGDLKIIPRHMQYYAVDRILNRIDAGEKRRGLIWHTQGSGKSYSMLFAAKNLLDRGVLGSPQVFIIVDTDKLATQMAENLAAIGFDRSTVAESIDHLERLVEQGRSELVLTTIHKFQKVAAGKQGNPEVVVFADEAHRFMEKLLGNKLEGAMPDAWHFGFTGTPVHEGDTDLARSTFRNYCPDGENPLHWYSIRDGLEDEVILPVYFTLRHDAVWEVDEEEMNELFEEAASHLSKDQQIELIKEALTPRELGELPSRIKKNAEVIDDHFRNVEKNGWKGMVVAPSKKSAAMYADFLTERRSADEIGVLYTEGDDDPDVVRRFQNDPDERSDLVRRFKKRDENPKLLVVHQMLLTGFDAPILKVLYLDRRLTDHTLLQAIARTNRPAEGKVNGEIVDFQGVFENLDEALSYDSVTREHAARDRESLFEDFSEQLDKVFGIFEGIEKKRDDQETVQRALGVVSKHPERRQFKQGYRRLQDLYESVSPDARLVGEEVAGKYNWLSRIWIAFRRANNRDEKPEETLREKTREIVQKHVDVVEVKKDFPVYKLGHDRLESIEQLDHPAARATSIAHATKSHLRPRVEGNPRYQKLSERVEEVLSRWQAGEMKDPDAVEALEQLELDVLDVEREAEQRELGKAEHAVFALLKDEHGLSTGEAERVAETLCEAFEQKVDRDYDGWKARDLTRKQGKQAIVAALKETDRLDLFTEAADDIFDYLLTNYGRTDTNS